MDSILQAIPNDLNGLYLHLLNSLDEKQARVAKEIMKWVVLAPRPMQEKELAIACALEFDDDIRSESSLDSTLVHGISHNIRLCGPLLKIQQQKGVTVIHLVHQSLKEFLLCSETARQSIPQFAITPKIVYGELAITCLRYLSFEEFDIGPVDLEVHLGPRGWSGQRAVGGGTRVNHRNVADLLCDLNRIFCRHDFLHFAATYWPHFVRLADEVDTQIFDAFCQLASSDRRLHLAFQIHEITDPDAPAHNTIDRPSVLYVSAYAGLPTFIDRIVKRGYSFQLSDNSALYAAAMNGRQAAVRALLGAGAKTVAESGYFGNALGAAVAYGHRSVIELLLENKPNFDDALHAAIHNNSVEILKLLLERGANPNGLDARSRPALHAAAYNGSDQIARILLENGADVHLFTLEEGTALHVAASRGHVVFISLLATHGADVNVFGGEYGYALDAAVCLGCDSTVFSLLCMGADVHVSGTLFANLLQLLRELGHKSTRDRNSVFKISRLLFSKSDPYNLHITHSDSIPRLSESAEKMFIHSSYKVLQGLLSADANNTYNAKLLHLARAVLPQVAEFSTSPFVYPKFIAQSGRPYRRDYAEAGSSSDTVIYNWSITTNQHQVNVADPRHRPYDVDSLRWKLVELVLENWETLSSSCGDIMKQLGIDWVETEIALLLKIGRSIKSARSDLLGDLAV